MHSWVPFLTSQNIRDDLYKYVFSLKILMFFRTTDQN